MPKPAGRKVKKEVSLLPPDVGVHKRVYRCKDCGKPKKGHICEAKKPAQTLNVDTLFEPAIMGEPTALFSSLFLNEEPASPDFAESMHLQSCGKFVRTIASEMDGLPTPSHSDPRVHNLMANLSDSVKKGLTSALLKSLVPSARAALELAATAAQLEFGDDLPDSPPITEAMEPASPLPPTQASCSTDAPPPAGAPPLQSMDGQPSSSGGLRLGRRSPPSPRPSPTTLARSKSAASSRAAPPLRTWRRTCTICDA